jgi:hypothetical protein
MSFKAHGHLKDHMKRHLNIRPHECGVCKAKFARTSTLKIHSQIHVNNKSEDKDTVVESPEKSLAVSDNSMLLMNYFNTLRSMNPYAFVAMTNMCLFNPMLMINQQQQLFVNSMQGMALQDQGSNLIRNIYK